MTLAEIREQLRAIEEKYGRWTAHNICLGQGVYTIEQNATGEAVKLRRIVQTVSDACGRRIDELRVLDLACLEGMYGIELAAQGATVCAIEGREANLEKARFAARALSLDNIAFHLDDVRNLSEGKYGRFEVVLCLGILYHLDAPDVFAFLESVFDVCDHLAVIDTHVSVLPEQSFVHKAKTYWGKRAHEHAPAAGAEEREKSLWASLDNPQSVHLTRPSLFNLLADIGFTSAYECHVPQEPDKERTRATFVAIKGEHAKLITTPAGHPHPLPERFPTGAMFRNVVLRPGLRIARKIR